MSYTYNFAAVPENCSRPTIDNAYVNSSYDSIESGETYTVVCTGNFSLYGSNTMECNDDGTLSMAPACIGNATYCTAPEINNGYVEPLASAIEQDQYYTIYCNPGYISDGNDTVFCLENGNLSSTPNCTGEQ